LGSLRQIKVFLKGNLYITPSALWDFFMVKCKIPFLENPNLCGFYHTFYQIDTGRCRRAARQNIRGFSGAEDEGENARHEVE
jgi:hypothetical protein